ncbi:hypothetical protein M1397_00830 [Candidatus Marsarchaeota archaeon]|nr:hypothetical protein [Candidatus Marsarchaeota archaeon]
MRNYNTFPYLAIAIFSTLLFFGVTYAQYGYGTSSITLSNSSASLVQGKTYSLGYTVNLASGSTWGTTLSASNQNQLSASGITVALSKTYADPPYSGTAAITIGATTPPGKYNVTFVATGDDPSSSPAVFTFTVSVPTPTTTAPTTTAQSTAPTTLPTTASTTPTTIASTSLPVATTPASSGSTLIIVVVVIIIIAAAAVAAAAMRKNRPKAK